MPQGSTTLFAHQEAPSLAEGQGHPRSVRSLGDQEWNNMYTLKGNLARQYSCWSVETVLFKRDDLPYSLTVSTKAQKCKPSVHWNVINLIIGTYNFN